MAAKWYQGQTRVAGVLTAFYVLTEEALNKIAITEAAENVTFADETISLELTGDYSNSSIATLLETDVNITEAIVTGQDAEVDASHWVGEFDMTDMEERVDPEWGHGTRLERGDGEIEETFFKIARVADISGPCIEVDQDEFTDHDSPDGWEEIIPTVLRSGEVTFDLSWIPENMGHINVVKDLVERKKRNWRLVFPDTNNTTWSFAAYVVGFDPEFPPEERIQASVTLKPTGKPILADIND